MKNESYATALSSPLRGGAWWGLLLLCLLLASCGSKKHAVSSVTTLPGETDIATSPTEAGRQADDAARQEQTCITARLRMELSSGGRGTTVGGTLRMKRNDVIQLSVVAFGIIEVALIEMTPDYFMVVDKMGKQYVKAPYGDVPFLRNANVDFYTIQTFFWDEQSTNYSGWERWDFVSLAGRNLPTRHRITIPNGSKPVKADLTLSGLKLDSAWETRTQLSARYAELPVEELLSRIMELTL